LFGLLEGSTVLCVAPHPDDETLGCGGTLAKLASRGYQVFVCAISVGDMPLHGSESFKLTRQREFSNAMTVLGVAGAEICWTDDARHARLDLVGQYDLIRLIEAKAKYSLATVRPDLVLMPFSGGMHQDHRAVHQATFAACRPHSTDVKHVPRNVLGYRIPEELAWNTSDERYSIWVDTSEFWQVKSKALENYSSQMKPAGHPRSIENIELVDRAAGAKIGWRFAEEFVCYRISA
jgi:LmbE family N-acetylglucosaminyl deacetylase